MSEIIVQYDSIEVDTIPADAVAVAGYVGGSWPDFSQLVARFPNARHKSITPTAAEDADILDIESGDAIPSQYPDWHRRQKARGLALPGPYADASTMPAVQAACEAAGIDFATECAVWGAWLGSTELPGLWRARQYTFTALGRNLDASVCLPDFWGDAPSPPVKNAPHYDWFPDGHVLLFGDRLSERATVEAYDEIRKLQAPDHHPERAQLALLRERLHHLAGRVFRNAHRPLVNGKPTWGVDRRGWRYQQLVHRAQGQRFV